MLNDFIFHNPTKIYFGRTALSHLKEALAEFGPRVLLVYGKGAIKRSGLYSAVMKELAAAGKQVTELAGVSPNPRYSEVLSGAALVRENEIDLIEFALTLLRAWKAVLASALAGLLIALIYCLATIFVETTIL